MFSVNQVFSSLTGRRSHDDFCWFASVFPLVETLNGHIPDSLNRSAAAFATQWRKSALGGSDSHTLHGLGRTYTEIHGARTIKEFLAGVRTGHGQVRGESGTHWKLTRAICAIACAMSFEKPWTLVLAPLLFAVPLATMNNLIYELLFNYRWTRRLQQLGSPERIESALSEDLVPG